MVTNGLMGGQQGVVGLDNVSISKFWVNVRSFLVVEAAT